MQTTRMYNVLFSRRLSRITLQLYSVHFYFVVDLVHRKTSLLYEIYMYVYYIVSIPAVLQLHTKSLRHLFKTCFKLTTHRTRQKDVVLAALATPPAYRGNILSMDKLTWRIRCIRCKKKKEKGRLFIMNRLNRVYNNKIYCQPVVPISLLFEVPPESLCYANSVFFRSPRFAALLSHPKNYIFPFSVYNTHCVRRVSSRTPSRSCYVLF